MAPHIERSRIAQTLPEPHFERIGRARFESPPLLNAFEHRYSNTIIGCIKVTFTLYLPVSRLAAVEPYKDDAVLNCPLPKHKRGLRFSWERQSPDWRPCRATRDRDPTRDRDGTRPGRNSSKMNTYERRAGNPFRMRTYKTRECNPIRMNTYKNHGGGVPIMVTQTSADQPRIRRSRGPFGKYAGLSTRRDV
jgi:hypothetical protein